LRAKFVEPLGGHTFLRKSRLNILLSVQARFENTSSKVPMKKPPSPIPKNLLLALVVFLSSTTCIALLTRYPGLIDIKLNFNGGHIIIDGRTPK
jgi:hypothetical protein